MPYAFEKSIFASKTFWVNFVTALIAILTFFVGQDYVANNPSIAPLFVAALSGLNIVLRYITSTAVTLAVLFMLSLAVAGGSTAMAAVVDVVSVAGADDVAADFKLPLAPNKPPKVVAVSLARPGYVCDANGCRPVAGAAASACGPGGCRSAARGGKVRSVIGKIFGK